MIKNMKQVNKLIEHVQKDMNMSELAKIMEKFEQVRLPLFFYSRLNNKYNNMYFLFRNLKISMSKNK